MKNLLVSLLCNENAVPNKNVPWILPGNYTVTLTVYGN